MPKLSQLPVAAGVTSADYLLSLRNGADTLVPASSIAGQAGLATVTGQVNNIKASYVDPRDWNGWDPLGANPIDTILQAAINASIANNIPVIVPSGTFLLSQTINCIPFMFETLDFRGNGGFYTFSQAPFFNPALSSPPATIFTTTFSDRPAFTVDYCRGATFRDFVIRGNNVAPSLVTVPHDIKADYISAGCRNAQHSPYCGFQIDGFNTAPPADVYPGFDGFTAAATFTNGSADIQINNSALAFDYGRTVSFNASIGTGANGVVAGTYYYVQQRTATTIQVSTLKFPYRPSIVFNAGGSATATGTWYNPGQSINGSSHMILERVGVIQFVVGVAHTPSGTGSQSDYVTYRDCNVNCNYIDYAFGQSQSKICMIDCGSMGGNSFRGLDGLTYGAQSAVPPKVHGVGFGVGYQLFAFDDAYGPLSMDMCYAESMRTFGTFGKGGSSGRSALLFTGGRYSFGYNLGYGPPPPIQLETFGPCCFKGVEIQTDSVIDPQVWNFVSNLVPIDLEQCDIQGSLVNGHNPFVGVSGAQNTQPFARLNNCWFDGQGGSSSNVSDFDTTIALTSGNNRLDTTAQVHIVHDGTGEYEYIPANANGTLTTAITALAVSTTAITFTGALLAGAKSGTLSAPWALGTGYYPVTFSNAEVHATFLSNGQTTATWGTVGLTAGATASATVGFTGVTFTSTSPFLFQNGDVCFWKMVAQGVSTAQQTVLGIKVTNVSGNNITCSLLWDATQYLPAASQGSFITIAQNQWAPTTALTCTTDGTTAVITAVSPTNILLNGDWVGGAGIPANSRVVSGGGTATVTLSQNTTAAASGVALRFGGLNKLTSSVAW